MAEPNPRENPITVEDLLRLKRCEQPDEAFWATFEERLHKKTLQTLVKRETWPARLRRRISAVAHPALAMPAAAALALGLYVASPLQTAVTMDNPAESPAAQATSIASAEPATPEFTTADVDARFAANTMESEQQGTQTHYTKLRANRTLTTDHEHIHYASSTYTTAQHSYAVIPANAVY